MERERERERESRRTRCSLGHLSLVVPLADRE